MNVSAMDSPCLDVAGIGAGPFNLSVAALLAPLAEVRSAFFERRARYAWHPGMMLPGAKLQTSFLKDLVTAADPTSAYSFLAYLVAHGRFYRFLNAEFGAIERREFADYLQWVAGRLPNLLLGHEVREVQFGGDGFVLHGDGQRHRARNLVVAIGATPYVPEWAPARLMCLHTHQYLERIGNVDGLRIAVVGGGQSGAEVVLDLLSGTRGQAAAITWLSRRQTFEALDETAFINEFFTPHYVDAFHRLHPGRKAAIVAQQKLASDGISRDTLTQLYQTLYMDGVVRGDGSPLRLLPHRDVHAMEAGSAGAWRLTAHNGFDGGHDVVDADLVILATGYLTRLPDCLAGLHDSLDLDADGRYRLQRDFSVQWDGPAANGIYVQNAGRHSHGIAEPQLSLAAWRGAVIANAILGHARYATGDAALPIEWASRSGEAAIDKAA